MSHDLEFPGWTPPLENWVKCPKDLILLMPRMKESELKVTLYILTHTWGYHNYDKFQFMTVDEIMKGRRAKGEGRLDNGTGLSKQSVINGIKAGIGRGTLEEIIISKDKARIRKGYKLRGRDEEGSKILTPGVQILDPEQYKETSERSYSTQPKAEDKKSKPKKTRKPTKRDKYNAVMEQAFVDATKKYGPGIPLPMRSNDKERKAAGTRWNNPLWRIYRLFMPEDQRQGPLIYEEEILNLATTLIELAVDHAKSEGLVMDAPAAIEKVAVSIFSDGHVVATAANDFWDRYKPNATQAK